ncbi:hypothetical protein [Xanthocytophaga agilis]|uniref:Uncharacterized protein n=1 Tax=Xanthocytophaga agilis TaxID=3048010 RepID=A0AAE3UFE6_9BACT|nr:hypothetical protein [Xanthocytophaga agilis]MDJ1501272.1 hypothetical protein [Xanthocytophaga agilis]
MKVIENRIKTIFIILFVLSSCENSSHTNNGTPLCSGISVRLLYSMVGSQFDQLKKVSEKKSMDSAIIRDLNYYISDFMHYNDQYIVAAGGFLPGENINLANPCRKDEHVTKLAGVTINQLKYRNFVALLRKAGLLENGQDTNLYFIIDSHFCKTNCVFSDDNLSHSTIGTIMLENITLQLTILDLTLSA